VIEAARIFYEKGASPRHIRAQLTNNVVFGGSLGADTILAAAYDFCASTDHNSAIYAELWAIKACSSRAFFPWNADLKNYSFPEHLAGVVNPTNGDVDRAELDKRLKEIQPYVNV
jgi:hypothetical protein